MDTYMGPKGKVFTHVVRKDEVPVLIQTTTHLVHGHLYVRPDSRLLDELNETGDFLPVTEAVVLDASGEELHRAEFMSLNRTHIVWVLPQEEHDDH